MTWTLIDAMGKPFESYTPGTLGGHRRRMLYGLFNCRAAAHAIARDGDARHRVFFLDEVTAKRAHANLNVQVVILMSVLGRCGFNTDVLTGAVPLNGIGCARRTSGRRAPNS